MWLILGGRVTFDHFWYIYWEQAHDVASWITPFCIWGGNANVNRMAIVKVQQVSERHQLSESGSPIVFVNRTAIVEAQHVSEGDQLGERGLPPKWRRLCRNTTSSLVPRLVQYDTIYGFSWYLILNQNGIVKDSKVLVSWSRTVKWQI